MFLLNSVVDVEMVSTRKRTAEQEAAEREWSNQNEQTEIRDNLTRRGTSSDKISNPTQVNYPQVDVHTLEEKNNSKVRNEVDIVMTSVSHTVQDAVLTPKKCLLVLAVELAMKSANALLGQSVDGNVLEPDQMDFLCNIRGLPMTASSRKNSRRDLKKIDETHGKITAEERDLLLNEKNIDRQIYTHHIVPGQNAP